MENRTVVVEATNHARFVLHFSGSTFVKVNHPKLWNLAKRIALVTQMRTDSSTSASPIQVTNYGLAGLCEPHIDPVGLMEVKELGPGSTHLPFTGDIMGTFMAWLSDTKAGGGTAFLSPGFENIVMPEKGAALFWYDLMSDGTRDFSTAHGGCPILSGSKWILNKWMHAYDNFLRWPCNLKPQSRFQPPSYKSYF